MISMFLHSFHSFIHLEINLSIVFLLLCYCILIVFNIVVVIFNMFKKDPSK